MPEIQNPHDHFARETLSRKEVAVDFLARFLPAEISAILDLTALELVNDSFVDAELREHLSDLIFRVGLHDGGKAFVYVLFEHKSAPDNWVAFQLARYKIRVWEQEREQGAKKLSPVFPLILYHGRSPWNV